MNDTTRQSKRPSSRMSATSMGSRKDVNGGRQKRQRTSVYEIAASSAADGMAVLGEQIKAALNSAPPPPVTKFDLCLEILNDMMDNEIISTESYFNISRVLIDNEKNAAMLSGMMPRLRMQ